MLKHLSKSLVLVLLTILGFAVGVTQADNRVFPTVTATWPRLYGAVSTKQTAVYGYKVGADDYDFAGQSVISAQRSAALFSLVPTTGITTPVTFTDGSAANFDIGGGVVPLTNGNYAWVGEKLVTTIDTRGSIFIRTSAGAAVSGVHTFGTTNTLTRFNKAIQLSGGASDGKLALVGFTTQAGNAGLGDMYYARTTVGATITAERVAMIGTTSEDEGYAICQVSDTELALGGRTKSGSNNNFYVKLINISDGTSVGTFTLSGAAGTGNDDAIRKILKDADGNLVIIGTSGTTTARVGYIAKINPTTGALIAGYEFTTAATDVELMDAEILANGHIVATGRQGADLYLTEIQDNGTAYVMDWAHSYDSGRTGDVGNFVKVETDGTILVAGNCNDTGTSTDAAFWLFDEPAVQANAGPTAFNLLTPTTGSTTTLTPTLTWEASTDAILGYAITYELTWADNSSFTGATVVPGLTTNEYVFTAGLSNDNTYYWKVKALDGNDHETLCTQDPDGFNFLSPVTPPPAAFNLLTPVDGATTTLTPTLTWEVATGTGVVYELTWADNASFTGATVVPDIATAEYVFTAGLSNDNTYYWKVKAIDALTHETLCTQAPDGWSFLSPVTAPPAAFDLLTPADGATTTLTPTLTWEVSTGTGVVYELTWADNALFTGATVVPDIATAEYVFTAGLSNDNTYYWKVSAIDVLTHATLCTQAPDGWSFSTPVTPPTAFNLLTPADGATVTVTPTLTWEVSTGNTIEYELTWADNSSFTGATVVSNLATAEYVFTAGLSNDNTYYWKVKAIDVATQEVECTQAPDGWSFVTPTTPPGAFSVGINSTVASTPAYYDNANVAGYDPLAADGFDAYDVPEPPLFGNNYIRTYINESGFTSFRQKLTRDIRSTVGKNYTLNSYLFNLNVSTDQTANVTLTFDATTDNAGTWPVVFWDGTDFQNVLGSVADNTYVFAATGTTGVPDAKSFAILVGDKTAPVVTPVYPLADGTSELSRSSLSVLQISVDNTSPIRRTSISFSPAPDLNTPRQNWTTLAGMPVTPATPDDPTNGIVNADLTHNWIPATDDPGIFASPTDVFPEAQLRYVTEDWAGNVTTTYVDFAIVPDGFSFTGDYAEGWHLISLPLTPDDTDPATMFTTATGNNNGIAGGYSMFQYSLAAGYTEPVSVAIAKGYWLVLDQDNTAAASNSGLGTVSGTIPGAAINTDLALDPAAPNFIGVAVRNEDLGTGHLQADDWEFSTDDFTNTFTWTEATTIADKNGDVSIWIDATSLVSYRNATDDYSPMILADANLVPGKGYLLLTGTPGSGTIKMRTNRTAAAVDIVRPGTPINNGSQYNVNATDEFTGEWNIPVHMSIGQYSNDLSGFGCRSGATDGWDNGIDVTAPPLPPSGNYVRAVVDGQTWGSPFGRFFVTDVRAPFGATNRTASWDFRVNASENGLVTMTFDLAALTQYEVPATFGVTATVNGQTFNLSQSNVVTFNYTGGIVIVHIVASLDGTTASEPLNLAPKDFSIVNSYPNPFNPETSVRIGMPNAAKLQVAVYNSLGKEVARLAEGTFPAGYHNFTFDAHSLSSGTYFVRALTPGKQAQVKRIVLVR